MVRRLARARSREMAAVAAASAAARAMRVICQPGMPPAVITWTVPPFAAGAGPYGPSPGTGMIAAEAAGTAAAQASTAAAATDRTVMIRRSCVPPLGRGARPVVNVNIVGSCCSDRAGRSGLDSRLSRPAGVRAAAGLPLSRRHGGRGRTTPHGARLERAGSDQAFGQGQAGQVGAAAAAGLVPDPVQV